MEQLEVIQDIVQQTGGDIYVGVVGPVRTGKSTFIKRFMELIVLPNIEDPKEKQRAIDELPQSSAGRTIMTTEPKFIPEDGIDITIRDNISFRVRMVDCVGYTVPGALGYEEDDGPRMVRTPWFDHEIPFEEAAENGTRKVITEHSTIGLVITTDGSITDIEREAYVPAEERVVEELSQLGKPFAIILNSVHPLAAETQDLAVELEAKCNVPVIPLDCLHTTLEDVNAVLEQVLYEFPIKEVKVELPLWLHELSSDHELRQKFENATSETVEQINRLRDVELAVENLSGYEFIDNAVLSSMELGTGIAHITMTACESCFLSVLGELCSTDIDSKEQLLRTVKDLSLAKREYDRLAPGLREMRHSGYGVVPPQIEDMVFEQPELVRRGNQFGVRLRARAPSVHLIRADVETEVTPIIGTEKQSEELVKYLLDQFEDDPARIWGSEMFGRSLEDLLREGLQSKLFRMPENAQAKLQETLERIVNEGSGGLICIII